MSDFNDDEFDWGTGEDDVKEVHHSAEEAVDVEEPVAEKINRAKKGRPAQKVAEVQEVQEESPQSEQPQPEESEIETIQPEQPQSEQPQPEESETETIKPEQPKQKRIYTYEEVCSLVQSGKITQEQAEYYIKKHLQGDKNARNQLIEHNL